MRLVVFFNLYWRNRLVRFDFLAAHGLHNNSLGFHLLEFAKRIILRLKRFDERVAIATEIFADDVVHLFLNEVVRDLEIFLLEGLKDQLPIDQIFERSLSCFFDFTDQLIVLELRTQ